MNNRPISKLVLPVAGFGTRLLPLTANTPKSLIELRGRPLLDYILEEAEISGLKEIFLIVRPKEEYIFWRAVKKSTKHFPHLRFRLLMQKEPLGTGHAIVIAARYLRGESFAVRYTDDILIGKIPALKLLMTVFQKHRTPLFALERVPWGEVHRYGVVSVARTPSSGLHEVGSVIERPRSEELGKELRKNFSNLAVIGAYVLTPALLGYLKETIKIVPHLQDVLPITLAFHRELAEKGRVYGVEFPGIRLDCGTLSGFRKSELYLKKQKFGN